MPEDTNKPNDTTATAPEVNEITPPPEAIPTTESNVSEPAKETTEKNAEESLPEVKQAPSGSPDPVEMSSAGNTDKTPAASMSDQSEEHTANHNDGADIVMEDAQANAASHTQHDHRNNKKFAAVLVVVIAVILSLGATFIYLSSQDNAQETETEQAAIEQTQSEQESIPEEPVEPATTEAVDQTIQDIDQTLESLDSDADFGDDQLSDGALGL